MGRKALLLFLLTSLSLGLFAQRIISLEESLPKTELKTQHIDHVFFEIGYSNQHKQSQWVAYKLTKEMVETKIAKRISSFRIDKKLDRKYASTNNDYRNSGYDRGHLCPAGDMRWSKDAMYSTFMLSNISPQTPSFNRGIWKDLEDKVKDWAVENDSIIVITGPILNNFDGEIGDGVPVPRFFYKIIIDISPPTYKAIGFIIENDKVDLDLEYLSFTLRCIESIAALDFFPNFHNDELIEELETNINLEDWSF